MMKLKPKMQEAPAPVYVPTGLLKPRLSDRRCGWNDPAKLTEYFRGCCSSELDFCIQRLSHAQLHHKECAELLQDFRDNMDASDPKAKKALARFEQDVDAASAEVQHAEALLHCEQEAA